MDCTKICIAIGWLLVAAGIANADQSIELAVNMQRSTFYRGEMVSLKVVWEVAGESEIKGLVMRADVGGVINRSLDAKLADGSARGGATIRVDSTILKVGDYQIVISAWVHGEPVGSTSVVVTIASPPNPDRMPVWLWPHKAYLDQLTPFNDMSRQTLDWWSSHGFTELALGEHLTRDLIAGIEYTMKQGRNVCVLPNGGLESGAGFSGEDDDIWFKINDGEYLSDPDADKRILNPFHPKVQAWQDHENETIMRRLATYPNVKSAFFNTEIVDRLQMNQNEHSRRAIEQVFGAATCNVDEPNYVAPGVIADDDTRYRMLRYQFREGNGLAVANKRAADMIHRYRPDMLTINDPYRESALLDGFPGVDVIGSWTYVNPDPKLMLYVETLRAVCRYSDHIPLSVVTLLNYPGELTPNEAWTMMGPGRLAVTTWINLSRAPKMLGYYFSSACDPFASLEDDLVTPKNDVSEEALPPATYDMMKRLSDEVFKPYGPVIRKLEPTPRPVALLSSAASELYGSGERLLGYYPNMQVYHFYSVLAMAQIPADVVFDEHVTRYGLDEYDVLVLPRCAVLPESVYKEVVAFMERGGLVIADQYLGPEIPGVVKFDFDFSYRERVKALALSHGRGYVGWDDHLQPDSADVKTVKGVTAQEDQDTMESYAAELRDTLDGRISRAIDCDSPTVLLSMLEGNGGSYLVAVNDKRVYDQRVGKYRAVLGEVVSQETTITLNEWPHDTLAAYDMLERQSLDVKNDNGKFSFKLELTDLGGSIVAFYPRPIKKVLLSGPGQVRRGQQAGIVIRMTDSKGDPTAGLQPVRLTLRDPDGEANELSDYYYLHNGYAMIIFVPALNDATGMWTLDVEDLTAGYTAAVDLEVIDGLP